MSFFRLLLFLSCACICWQQLRADVTGQIRLLLMDSAERIFTVCHPFSAFKTAEIQFVSSSGNETTVDLIILYNGLGIPMNNDRMNLRVTFAGASATSVTLNSDTGTAKPGPEQLHQCVAIINHGRSGAAPPSRAPATQGTSSRIEGGQAATETNSAPFVRNAYSEEQNAIHDRVATTEIGRDKEEDRLRAARAKKAALDEAAAEARAAEAAGRKAEAAREAALARYDAEQRALISDGMNRGLIQQAGTNFYLRSS